MGKALMVTAAIPTDVSDFAASYYLPAGAMGIAITTEARHQLVMQQAAVMSDLGMLFDVAGSGESTLVSRKNGVDGAQLVVADSGVVGFHTDTDSEAFALNDVYGLKFSENASRPGVYAFRQLIDLAPDYGNYIVKGNDNVTWESNFRWSTISGTSVTVTDAQLSDAHYYLVRGYTHIKGMQVLVASNPRSSDTTFELFVNGVSVASVVVPAGSTGVHSEALDISLADGDLLIYKITTGAGTGTLAVPIVALLATSTENEIDVLGQGASSFVDSETYIPLGSNLAVQLADDTNLGLPIGYVGELRNFRFLIFQTHVGETYSVSLRKNGVDIITLTGDINAGWVEDTSSTVSFGPTDTLSIRLSASTPLKLAIPIIGATLQNTLTIVPSVGSASGTSEVSAVGDSVTTIASAGTSTGAATVEGVTPVTEAGVGTASGSSVVSTFGAIVQEAVGTSEGSTSLSGTPGPLQPIQAFGFSLNSAEVVGVALFHWAGIGLSESRSRCQGAGRQVGWLKPGTLSSSWVKQEADI